MKVVIMKYGIPRLPVTYFLSADMIQKRSNKTHWLLLEDKLAFNYIVKE